MRVSKKDDEIIDALARTRTVKKIAEFLHEDFSEQKLADLVAAIIFFKIRGEEEDQGFDFFMKDQNRYITSFITSSAIQLLPLILTDFKFIKKLIQIKGKKLDLFSLFKKKEPS